MRGIQGALVCVSVVVCVASCAGSSGDANDSKSESGDAAPGSSGDATGDHPIDAGNADALPSLEDPDGGRGGGAGPTSLEEDSGEPLARADDAGIDAPPGDAGGRGGGRDGGGIDGGGAADATVVNGGQSEGGQGEDAGGGTDAGTMSETGPESDAGSTDGDVDSASAGSNEDAGGDTSPSSPSCGFVTGQRGLTSRSLDVNGVTRTYLLYLPASLDPTKPIPFVFAFHGYLMSGQSMHDLTLLATLADSEGFGVAFPDGEGGPDSIVFPWDVENPGQAVCGWGQLANAGGDDFAFMDAMKADVLQDQCLDSSHVFATGFSMGGYFVHHVGCYRSDIRAVAPHSGGTIDDLSSCTTGHVPIIIFHGTSDATIAEACDDPTGVPVLGFTASATLWAAKNGCQPTYSTVPMDGDGGGTGQCYVYDGCPADGQVELCTFNGMTHCWAGGPTSNGCPTFASATELEWSFFKQYAW